MYEEVGTTTLSTTFAGTCIDVWLFVGAKNREKNTRITWSSVVANRYYHTMGIDRHGVSDDHQYC